MGRTFEVHIDRYDPRRAPAAYCQRYEIESHSSMTVLELLTEIQRTVDDTLAFRTSCQIGKCGSCAVSLNGRPVLACRTVIDGPAVRLGPLPHFQPLHDLIVDREQFEDRRVRVIADALGNAEHPGPSFAALPDEHVEYGNVARCIGCLVCDSVCPVAAQVTDRYSGPALLSTSLSSGVRIRRRGLLATPIDGQMEYCSLCLNCELACPSGVALNRVNAQAKHEYTQEKGQSVRDRLMGHVELVGKVATKAPSFSNFVLHNVLFRRCLENGFRISRHASAVPYTSSFRRWFDRRPAIRPDGATRKLAYFAGCYVNYSDARAGQDMVAVLERLGIEVGLPEQRCCGLPLLSNGDMETARRRAGENVASLLPWIEQGYDVVATCTSCSLMLKHEYVDVLGVSAAQPLASRTHDLGAYLRQLADEGVLDMSLKPMALRAAYHAPCHLKAQKSGHPFVDLMARIPQLEVESMAADCCGLSGSYGFKAENYEIGMRIGRALFGSLLAAQPDVALSECGACQTQMRHGTGLPVAHPITILRQALL